MSVFTEEQHCVFADCHGRFLTFNSRTDSMLNLIPLNRFYEILIEMAYDLNGYAGSMLKYSTKVKKQSIDKVQMDEDEKETDDG